MTIIEIVMLIMLGVSLPTMLGLTIWATKTGRRTWSQTTTYYAYRNSWLMYLTGVLFGHWTITFIPGALNFWPYCAAFLIGVALKDIVRAIMKWPAGAFIHDPFAWLALGLISGGAFWKG